MKDELARAVGASKTNQQGITLRFFTICARNFLPSAKILVDSIRKVHPDCEVTVYLCDRSMGYDRDALNMSIAPLETLGIPALEKMIRTYNITELCTAIKPYCFLREFQLQSDAGIDGQVIYLDPDIELFSPLEEVIEAFNTGAEVVLTPHILGPAERAESHDQQFLKMGIYNLGFLAARNTATVADVMRWWGRRMVDQCVIDLAQGLFVDQKWADLLPAFLDHVKILRHPGYNVAYWNLHERRINGSSDDLKCNNESLRFVHYSGIILENTERLSRHSEMFHISNSFGYGALVTLYRQQLNAPENRQLRALPYAFFWDGAGKQNLHTPGQLTEATWSQPQTFLFAQQFFDLEQFRLFKAQESREIENHRSIEASLLPEDRSIDSFRFWSYCYTCAERRQLVTTFLYSTEDDAQGNPIPNWREHVACIACGLPNRVRASTHLFLQEFEPPKDAAIYMTEQKTRLYDWMSKRFSNLVGSEYFGNRVPFGCEHQGIRNENFENLTFNSESFDYLLSFDVLEHVAFPTRAFEEAYRVLKPGGYMMFSVPAHLDRNPTTTRAEIGPNGEIIHYMPAEYHGNPVDHEGGALCFRYYGWDVMDLLRGVGFRAPFIYHYWSRDFGYLGPDQVLFVAEKPK